MASADQLLKVLQHKLTECEDALKEDKIFNINEFDVHMRNFCEVIGTLPRDEAKQFERPLLEIGARLESISIEMSQKKTEISEKMQSLNTHKQANTAYAKQGASNKQLKDQSS